MLNSCGPDFVCTLGEVYFVAEASRRRLAVAKPYSVERYDFLVDNGARVFKVQIKTASSQCRPGVFAFRGRTAYSPGEIDFLIAYVVPADVWYIIPICEIAGVQNLRVYPYSQRSTSRWAKFREAWHLFTGDNPARPAPSVRRNRRSRPNTADLTTTRRTSASSRRRR